MPGCHKSGCANYAHCSHSLRCGMLDRLVVPGNTLVSCRLVRVDHRASGGVANHEVLERSLVRGFHENPLTCLLYFHH